MSSNTGWKRPLQWIWILIVCTALTYMTSMLGVPMIFRITYWIAYKTGITGQLYPVNFLFEHLFVFCAVIGLLAGLGWSSSLRAMFRTSSVWLRVTGWRSPMFWVWILPFVRLVIAMMLWQNAASTQSVLIASQTPNPFTHFFASQSVNSSAIHAAPQQIPLAYLSFSSMIRSFQAFRVLSRETGTMYADQIVFSGMFISSLAFSLSNLAFFRRSLRRIAKFFKHTGMQTEPDDAAVNA